MSNEPFASGENELPSSLRARGTQPREITGWTVLALMLAFFGVVIGVNAFMAHEALSTFSGVETDSSYRAGQTFERDVAMAKAQDAKHWQVDAKVTPTAGGGASLDIAARDAAGKPLAGMVATALFARPIDRQLDRSITVSEDAPGHFHGVAEIPAGQWDLIIELSRQGDRLFRSKNRVVIR